MVTCYFREATSVVHLIRLALHEHIFSQTPIMPIPDLPGILISRHSDQERWLKNHVARMCRFDNPEKQVLLDFKCTT